MITLTWLVINSVIKTCEEHEKLKQTTGKLEEKLENTLKEYEKLKERTRKLEEKLNKTDYILKEHEQLKMRTRKLEEKLNLQKLDRIVASQQKLQQDISMIKAQLDNKVTKSETLNMIDEKARQRESGINNRWTKGQEHKVQDDLNRVKNDLRREISSAQHAINTYTNKEIDKLYKHVGNVENTLQKDIDKVENTLQRKISQTLTRPAMAAPQMPVMPAQGMPNGQFMWYGACGFRPF